MLKEGKFGVAEAVSVLTVTICIKLFYTSPAYLVRLVGTAAWYTTAISALTSMAAFVFVCLLLKRFPNKNLVEIFEKSMGRVLGFFFSLLFALLLLQEASTFAREFADVMRVFTYPEMPIEIIIGALLIASVIGAYLGVESIARVSKLFIYLILFSVVGVLVLMIKDLNLSYIFPILGYGLGKTVPNGLLRSSAYAEVSVIAVFAPCLQNFKDIRKAGFISLIISGTVLTVTILWQLLLFPYFSSEELVAPFFAMARFIRYGTFFSRIDPILLLMWSISTVIAVSFLFYASVSVFCKMFRLTDKRPVILPMLIVCYTLAMLPPDFITIINGIVQAARNYNWIVFYGLPLIALVTAAVRNKKEAAPDA